MWELCVSYQDGDDCEYRHYASQSAAYKWCRDNLGDIGRASFTGKRHGVDCIVNGGRMICQVCGTALLDSDVGIYPICQGCDAQGDQ